MVPNVGGLLRTSPRLLSPSAAKSAQIINTQTSVSVPASVLSCLACGDARGQAPAALRPGNGSPQVTGPHTTPKSARTGTRVLFRDAS